MVLVIIGAALLVPRVVDLSFGGATWPLWIVVPGLAMLVGSFFIPPRGGLGLAIPGAIVTMVGLVLWVQETYDLYATWAYAWALVAPTALGLGMLLYGLVQRDGELARDGFRTTLVGLGLFLGFALFFEGVIGPLRQPDREPGRGPALRGDRPRRAARRASLLRRRQAQTGSTAGPSRTDLRA